MRHRGEILMPFHLVHTLLACTRGGGEEEVWHCIFSGSLHHNFHHLVFPSAFTSTDSSLHTPHYYFYYQSTQVRLYLQELSSSLVSIIAARRDILIQNKMRLSSAALIAVLATSGSSYISSFQLQHGVTRRDSAALERVTSLQAFKLKDGETKNMFEGPAPLVKERDACGVGFIANTQSGGK